MGDAIKRALDAATDRVMDEMGWKDDGSLDFEPVDTARHVAAGAIAAFLDALPFHRMQQGSGGIYSPDGTTTKKLAAAVTRAAALSRLAELDGEHL